MDVDAVLLARIQFAFTITFHIIFPSLSIGLAAFIATLLVRWRMNGQEHLRRLARFWTKIFAVSFAMGVVSGIVLSYQIGTNWANFSVVAGNIVGPLMGYEVLTAFFLEATFLGIMLFGWDRVSPNLHVASAVLVAVGTSMSAFWILSANSWMQTPAGFEMRDGIAVPIDWFKVIFNPSFPYRFAHMFTAAYLTTSLVVLAVGARYIVAGRFLEEAKTMIRMGLGMVAILAPLQLVIGDAHGLNTAEHQPVKVAAMEAHWDGSKPADLILFAWPDAKAEKNHFEISIPRLASVIIKHDPDGLFKGLKDFPADERPPLLPVFFAFRVMVGIGLLMIGIGVVGAFLWWRKRLFESTWFLKPVAYAWPLGFIAIVAGWWVTETGRQPYLVYGILRTADAVSPVAFGAVLTTLILFVLIYTSVFSMGILYINKLIAKGPQGAAVSPHADGNESAGARPLSVAREATRSALESKE
ncbi:cytochrome ubiquinol oxidase subunit I [Hyphomicrobium methylovorum]|uniref:cytochrome ubiquinol oxidase subunit I n=1 Tax=Hyphomicrobium methylovorum TaxID=84 RepID=UPI0015E78EE2|nr:cytochrome ubiquinol oxidase subunit I [Hyphomicrobium methylovorum]MBA2125988.1 cytochrome ubiquinol oxidase subunit I [Hyphomicrobium methylovorum]